MLLEPAFLVRLEPLALTAHRPRAGQMQGERRSTKRGTSVEFADYRDYARGDDLRRVDWNIYARLERPYVKLFEEEEDLAVHLLLDGSGSMDWGGEERGRQGEGETRGQGEEGANKWLYARRLAAALGVIALNGGDRLTITAICSPQPATFTARGRGHALRMLQWLADLPAGGTTDLNASLCSYALQGGRAGLLVLLSDLFSPSGYLDGLTALAARGHEIVVVHLLSPDEVDPPLGGDLRLLDVETGDPQEVSIDGGLRDLYHHRLVTWQDEIRAACQARDARYVPLTTDRPLEGVVIKELRQYGIVK